MAQPLPRMYRRQLRALDEQRLAEILLETGEPVSPVSAAGATAAGDATRLRGIPAVSRGTSGAVPGTDPLRALLWKESRRQR